MKPTTALTTATIAALALPSLSAPAADIPHSALRTPHSPPPNIIIILADDLGYGDLGFTGCKDIRTPNLDRFAATSMRLDNFHVCPICSPTRAGLMTGRWPLRFGLMKAVIPPQSKFGMPLTEKILPALLAPAGYEQRHMIGKWHLGHSRLAFLPANRGFTNYYGEYNGAFDYFTHIRAGEVDWHRDVPGKVSTIHEEGYSTDLMAAEAAKFISSDHAGKPFLLYLAFNAVHEPLQAKPADRAKYANADMDLSGAPGRAAAGKAGKKGKARDDVLANRRIYAAMTDSLDQNIGKILAAIDKLPDADNTIVLFFSDNGGLLPFSRNLPYRDGKFSVYEGGTRVAAAIRWPAAGLVGGKTSNALIGYIDVVPTMMRAAGLPLPTKGDPNELDGIDFMPILRGETPEPVRPWFSYFGQNENKLGASVTEGDWKLVVHNGDVLAPGKTPGTTYELYNITADPSEKRNLLADHPDIVKHLKTLLTAFGKLAIPDSEGVGKFDEGRAGFKAPKDWHITEP